MQPKNKFKIMAFEMANTGAGVTASPSPAQPQAGVSTLSNKTYDIFSVPPQLNYTTASNAGSGAATVTQYIFNNNVMNAAVTTNGSGVASIVNTYNDGFSGKVYENGFRSWNGGRGILIKGFLIQVTNYTSGAQVSSAFNTLAMQILYANFQAGTTPIPIDVSAGLTNAQYQVGILTLRQSFYLNASAQISIALPANTTMNFTFYTESSTF